MDTEDEQRSLFLERYIQGIYTRAELEENLPNLCHPENYTRTEETLARLWEESYRASSAPDDLEEDRYKKEAKELITSLRKEAARYNRQLFWNKVFKYVAILLIAASSTWGLHQIARTVSWRTVSCHTIEVVKGKHRQVTLPDGSKVLLNACSRLTVPEKFTGNERRVMLDGEGYFDILPDNENPFIITTKDADIQVIGTTFNVKAYSEDDLCSVCVESGRVQVEFEDATLRIHPGQQIIFDHLSGDMVKQRESAERVLSWREGGLYFNRTPLKSVVNELHRIYGSRIELAPEVDYTLRIHGEHENTNLESVLKSITYATQLDYKKENGKIIIYKK